MVIQKGLCEKVDSNLISPWIIGLALQRARKGHPGRKAGQEKTQGPEALGYRSSDPKEGVLSRAMSCVCMCMCICMLCGHVYVYCVHVFMHVHVQVHTFVCAEHAY